MTIEEAEEYYKRYLGHGFHMCREEPGRYNRFEALNLPKEYFVKWDADLLENEFEKLWTSDTWIHQGNIMDIIRRGHCNQEKLTGRLLDEMEKMDTIDLKNRILIIENMAGRTRDLSDGGCYFICRKTKQADRMAQIMERIIQPYNCEDRRFMDAVAAYRQAFKRYYHKSLRCDTLNP